MTLTTRQKLMIPLLILVLIFLVWEIIQTTKPSSMASLASQPRASFQAPPKQPAPREAAFSDDDAMAKPVKLNQAQIAYVNLVNQYKRLQMEKMIATSSQAIAQTRLKAAVAQEKLAKLSGQNVKLTTETTPKPTENKYQLVYTGKLQGIWTATLRKGNELIDVNLGNRLNNGAKVVAINGSEVVIRKGDTKEVISFTGTTRQTVKSTIASTAKDLIKKALAANETPKAAQDVHPSEPAKSHKPSRVDNANAVIKTSASKNESFEQNPVKSKKLQAKKKLRRMIETTSEITPSQISQAPVFKPVPVKKANTAIVKPVNNEKDQLVASPKFSPVTKPFTKTKYSPRYSRSEEQILQIDPELYTVQLIASYKPIAITQYVINHNLFGRSYQFQTKFHDRHWYALIYGQYEDIKSAVRAIRDLPDSMKHQKPFVRQVKIIQNEIKKQRIG